METKEQNVEDKDTITSNDLINLLANGAPNWELKKKAEELLIKRITKLLGQNG